MTTPLGNGKLRGIRMIDVWRKRAGPGVGLRHNGRGGGKGVELGWLGRASPGGLQFLQPAARCPLCSLVALPLVGELQPGEFVGIDGALADRPEFAVGLGQGRKARLLGPA